MCVCVCGVRGKEVGVQEEMPTGQSSETVVESEEELTVGREPWDQRPPASAS